MTDPTFVVIVQGLDGVISVETELGPTSDGSLA
jgi:hypothetical protein